MALIEGTVLKGVNFRILRIAASEVMLTMLSSRRHSATGPCKPALERGYCQVCKIGGFQGSLAGPLEKLSLQHVWLAVDAWEFIGA